MPEVDDKELLDLADAAIDGRINPSQLERLQKMVISDRRAAGLYADYVSLHATLWMAKGHPVERPGTAKHPVRPASASVQPQVGNKRWLLGLLGLAVTLCIAAATWLIQQRTAQPIAILAEVKGCKWDAGTLPTELGAKLTRGRLRLAEGLAHIVFNNGVEVRLESPADLEIVSPMRCIMHAGKLVAAVPANAKGFVVETPSSVVTDFGTEFGVSVGSDQSALVQVFRGRVDTWHRQSGDTEVMHAGASFLFESQSYGPCDCAEQSSSETNVLAERASQGSWIQVTTAQGRGRDTYIQPTGTEDLHRDKNLLLIKRPYEQQPQWERRVYLGFDLSSLEGRSLDEAQLSLSFAPTGLGFASLVPDAKFHVYGLADGKYEHWQEDEITWENAPGNELLPTHETISRLTHLGSFDLPQGDQTSTISIEGQGLRDFLNSDTNQLITMIVIRETEGIGPSDLVHGFASRRHPTLPPPTLRLKLNESSRLSKT